MTQQFKRKPTPLSLKHVCLEGGFWGRHIETNRKVTLPAIYEAHKESGRIDAYKLNWKLGQPNPPHLMYSGDVAKWIEGVSYSLASHPDKKLERLVDRIIDQFSRGKRPEAKPHSADTSGYSLGRYKSKPCRLERAPI